MKLLPMDLVTITNCTLLRDKWTKNARANSVESAESDHTDCTTCDALNQRIGIVMPTPCYF